MKNRFYRLLAIVFIPVAALTCSHVDAQSLSSGEVPGSARAHYARLNTGQPGQWSKGVLPGTFDVAFSARGTDMVYVYTRNGSLYQKKRSTSAASLPAPAKSVLNTDYAGFSTEAVYQVVSRSGRTYEVVARNADSQAILTFSTIGTLLRKKVDPIHGNSSFADAGGNGLMRGDVSEQTDEEMEGLDDLFLEDDFSDMGDEMDDLDDLERMLFMDDEEIDDDLLDYGSDIDDLFDDDLEDPDLDF